MIRTPRRLDKKHNPESILKEAKKLQAQASKRKNISAADIFKKAVAKYESAILSGLADAALVDAQTSKGDCFFQWGQRVIAQAENLPYDKLDMSSHTGALSKGCDLFQAAVQAYKQTSQGCSEWELDSIAAINCGNTLSIWAECCNKPEAMSLLQNAIHCYRHYLSLNQNDVEVQLNLSDALVHLAESFGHVNRREDCNCTFKEAMRSFQEAYEQLSSEKPNSSHELGDLLLRWGVSCVRAFEHSLDTTAREEYVERAIELLQKATEKNPYDVDVLNSLGQAFEAAARVHSGHEAMEYLQRALTEGYEVAKRVTKKNKNTFLGLAEVRLLTGKLCLKGGNEVAAQEQFTKSIHYYDKLLKSRSSIGGFLDHTEALYNYACCCALSGKESSARSALEILLKKEGTSILEICTDKDLKILSHYTWYHDLIEKGKTTTFF